MVHRFFLGFDFCLHSVIPVTINLEDIPGPNIHSSRLVLQSVLSKVRSSIMFLYG